MYLAAGFDSPQGPPKGLAHWFRARGKISGQPWEKLRIGNLAYRAMP